MTSVKKPYVSALDVHNKEQAANPYMPKAVGPNPTGAEIACVCGGVNEEPIPALYHPASRTVFPVRK